MRALQNGDGEPSLALILGKGADVVFAGNEIEVIEGRFREGDVTTLYIVHVPKKRERDLSLFKRFSTPDRRRSTKTGESCTKIE